MSFSSAPRSNLTTLFNHKFCLLCPLGFPRVRRFKTTDRREAVGAYSPTCFKVAAPALPRAVTSEDRTLSPPSSSSHPLQRKRRRRKEPLLWCWPHASAPAEPSHNHSPPFNRVRIKERAQGKSLTAPRSTVASASLESP